MCFLPLSDQCNSYLAFVWLTELMWGCCLPPAHASTHQGVQVYASNAALCRFPLLTLPSEISSSFPKSQHQVESYSPFTGVDLERVWDANNTLGAGNPLLYTRTLAKSKAECCFPTLQPCLHGGKGSCQVGMGTCGQACAGPWSFWPYYLCFLLHIW